MRKNGRGQIALDISNIDHVLLYDGATHIGTVRVFKECLSFQQEKKLSDNGRIFIGRDKPDIGIAYSLFIANKNKLDDPNIEYTYIEYDQFIKI